VINVAVGVVTGIVIAPLLLGLGRSPPPRPRWG
jgi:hypothetical protein